ncbi:MAG: hypothetical protein Kow0092_05070 [Deferrisomatales bacterium]
MSLTPSWSLGDALARLLDEEIAVCRDLLASTRAAAAALEAEDGERLEAALASRARHLLRLEALEKEASSSRGPGGALPARLRSRLQELGALTRELRHEDRRAQEAGRRALAALRAGIARLDRGRAGLRSYRGAASPTARFADRRG